MSCVFEIELRHCGFPGSVPQTTCIGIEDTMCFIKIFGPVESVESDVIFNSYIVSCIYQLSRVMF